MRRVRYMAGRVAVALVALLSPMGASAADPIVLDAEYTEPTTRYAHGVLGDDIEWGALRLKLDTTPDSDEITWKTLLIRLPEHRVFEDTDPRPIDLDGDRDREVVVVESDAAKGARLAIYDQKGLVAATPFIGRANRWLAPIGVADLDRDEDATFELAYVDRPHLAKTIRVWRFDNGKLNELGALPGFTNHRIGERDIAGGIRHCDGKPEMIVADANWSSVYAITFSGGAFSPKRLGPHKGRSSFKKAMGCKPL